MLRSPPALFRREWLDKRDRDMGNENWEMRNERDVDWKEKMDQKARSFSTYKSLGLPNQNRSHCSQVILYNLTFPKKLCYALRLSRRGKRQLNIRRKTMLCLLHHANDHWLASWQLAHPSNLQSSLNTRDPGYPTSIAGAWRAPFNGLIETQCV